MSTTSESTVILVGIDGSESSLNALDWAIIEAQARDWSLRLVGAYTVPSVAAATMDVAYVPFDDSGVRESVEANLRAAAERVRVAGVEVEAVVQSGDAAGVLVEESETARVAVVGTRGRGGFAGRLLGTVSVALPAHSRCPTAVIPTCWKPDRDREPLETQSRWVLDDSGREPDQEERGDLAPGLDHRGSVVVGVDSLGRQSPALWLAARYAARRGKPLEIVSVMTTTVLGPEWLPSAADIQRFMAECAEKLDACKYTLAEHHPGLQVSWRLYEGSPSEVLVRASDTADALVIGSRGRGGFAGLLLGSTSQAVLPHSRCPTIVVRVRKDDRNELVVEDI